MLDTADPPGTNSTILVDSLVDASAVDFDIASNSIFWADIGKVSIKRMWLDGSESRPQDIVHPGLVSPDGIAVDWIGHKLYWIDADVKSIEVSNFDGTYSNVLFWKDLDQPRAIALDPLNGYVLLFFRFTFSYSIFKFDL